MNTLQEVIDFLSPIPDEQWCEERYVNVISDELTQMCAIGHMNNKLCGRPVPYDCPGAFPEGPAGSLLESFGVEPRDLIKANNGLKDFNSSPIIKTRVLEFLNSKKVE